MIMSNLELARKFGRDKWDGPIQVLTRKDLAKQLNVSERTLRRWEKRGIINKPFNALQGAGRGNLAIYKDPMEGIRSVLTKGDNVYIRYADGRLRWRKRRTVVEESIVYGSKGDNNELV